MRANMLQAGERLQIDCRPPWLTRIITEACGAALTPGAHRDPDIHLIISGETQPFDLRGWDPLTRGAYRRGDSVVLIDACGSGFDLRVHVDSLRPHAKIRIDARFRPSARERIASLALRSRFHLLTRAALLQYPALWVAGTRGRVLLHAAVLTDGTSAPLLAGPGGVGRSTVLLQALSAGATACSDNLCVTDGDTVYGLVEPVRIDGATGRRMPHGRRECDLPNRVDALAPDQLVVLSRSHDPEPVAGPISPERAAAVLAAGTYMAGELRRYWAFAATLALGTGRGPMHPPIDQMARTCARLPATEITLGEQPPHSLADLLSEPTRAAS